MAAWVWVVAAAAVAFVAWFGFARRWWQALRYSWRRAAHAYREVEADYGSGPSFYGSMTLAEDPYADWREQTRVELAPETLDWLAAPPDDPGPGGALVSSSPPPGPDQRLCGPEQPHEKPAGTESAGSGHLTIESALRRLREERERPWPDERLADTGEIRDAHLLAEVAAELRAQDDDARAYCSALERDRQTYMHQLREVFA